MVVVSLQLTISLNEAENMFSALAGVPSSLPSQKL
jgi:hypothetical protein